jgi:hypothetical protein
MQNEYKIVGIPDTQNIWAFNMVGTPAEFLNGDGQTLLDEAVIKTVIGEQDISEWDATVAKYMELEGNIISQVKTEQFQANGFRRPDNVVIGE